MKAKLTKPAALFKLLSPAAREWAARGQTDGPFGLSVSTPAWVREKVAEIQGLELVLHRPQGWFTHQDVWTYKRVKTSD